MKNFFFTLLLILLLQPAAQAGSIIVFFNCASFYHPVEGQYMEVYFKIPVSSLGFTQSGKGNFTASAEISLLITTDKDTTYSETYTLNSPPVKDTFPVSFNLVDMRRVQLRNGKYNVHVKVRDTKNNSKAEFTHTEEVAISESLIGFSGIMLVDTFYPSMVQNVFSRNDYDFIPEVINYYPKEKQTLTFYSEMYNADNILPDAEITMEYYITTLQGKPIEGYSKRKKIKSRKINFIFDGIDIKSLVDGTYNFVIEARDDKKALLAKRSTGFFRNISPYALVAATVPKGSFGSLDPSRISAFLDYLTVISTKPELEEISALKKSSDTAALRQFFVKFWESRDAQHPYDAYALYSQNVDFVQRNFKTSITKGYKTDRGRTILKYGKPDYVAPYIDEQGAYPYEIWQYYSLKSQSNVHFIFYNPSLVENDYILLHSDAIGETKNPNWKQYIYRKINKDTRFDQNNAPQNYGDHVDERIKE